MPKEKVTRKALRNMLVGQTRTFSIDPVRLINSARVMCNQLKNEEGLTYIVHPEYDIKIVSITRTK